jgi:hypothetical protein
VQLTLQVSARRVLCRWNFSICACPSGHVLAIREAAPGSLLGYCERRREAESKFVPEHFSLETKSTGIAKGSSGHDVQFCKGI